MVIEQKSIGDRIRRRREYIKLRQEDVAEKLSMSQANYGKIENGKVGISASDLGRLANILGVLPSYLYGEVPPVDPARKPIIINSATFNGLDLLEQEKVERILSSMLETLVEEASAQ